MTDRVSDEMRRQIWLGDCTPTDGKTLLAEIERLEVELAALRAAPVSEEREAFEAAMKETWQMVDPLNPPGVPGSYARGEYNGIVAALQTMRDNFTRLLRAPQQNMASATRSVPGESGTDALRTDLTGLQAPQQQGEPGAAMLDKAFNLGQRYWQQADSQSYADNRRAEVTLAQFHDLRDAARRALATNSRAEGEGR